ncbi:hypothetical protein V6N11_042763 [Hibiscus sabdariffa]|uniref:Myb/SANT-like domain-containing protein n=1 Tax=Hibiscus sabdariffa TaxID=183260 RepID=A0ABR2QXA7_9ROSI
MSTSNIEFQKGQKQKVERIKSTATKRMWTKHEDAALIECLHTLAEDPHWKGDNGTFRSRYLSYLEKMLGIKLPTSQIRANPHIESRVKLLKRQYNALSEMLNIGSGFAETAADAIEDLDAEDNVFLDAFDAEVGGVKDFESRNEVGASTFQTYDAAVTTMKKDVSSKKRSRSEDGLSALVEEIGKFGAAYRETTQEIKSIAAFFKKEAEGNDRRMSIFTEIMEIEGFSKDECLLQESIFVKMRIK